MKKVCVDTNILIWYIKRQCTAGQEENLDKAAYLFKHFEENNIIVVIPSLVIAELLGNVEDEDEREEYFDYINSNFDVAQHDIVSARKYIELRLKLSKTNAKSYAKSNGVPKCQMTNDYNICSVALSSECDAVFSHNLKDFEKFADHQIPILTLDYVDVLKSQETSHKPINYDPQGDLFDDFTDDVEEDDEPAF
tara:strand:+ start:42512 stop:43093 length:582 start_codon:yes stop_codon:yes gene_type:complete